MRVIVNIHSPEIAEQAGWRAKAVQINDTNQSNLKEVLNTVIFENASTMHEFIIENNNIKSNFVLYVNGIKMPENPDFDLTIRDNVQIHLMSKH
ncbi:MAG: hypothetical protein JW864_16130 [Spirochaetes bacterium]|nr:hypothetical protein [Spirochaetota bacterium]